MHKQFFLLLSCFIVGSINAMNNEGLSDFQKVAINLVVAGRLEEFQDSFKINLWTLAEESDKQEKMKETEKVIKLKRKHQSLIANSNALKSSKEKTDVSSEKLIIATSRPIESLYGSNKNKRNKYESLIAKPIPLKDSSEVTIIDLTE